MVFSFKAQLSTDSVPENYADFFTRIIFNRLITNELCIKKETRFVKTEYISRFLKKWYQNEACDASQQHVRKGYRRRLYLNLNHIFHNESFGKRRSEELKARDRRHTLRPVPAKNTCAALMTWHLTNGSRLGPLSNSERPENRSPCPRESCSTLKRTTPLQITLKTGHR